MVGSSQTVVWRVRVRFRRRDEETSPLLTLVAWTAATLAMVLISGMPLSSLVIDKAPDS
jgi:hypothetical protein